MNIRKEKALRAMIGLKGAPAGFVDITGIPLYNYGGAGKLCSPGARYIYTVRGHIQ